MVLENCESVTTTYNILFFSHHNMSHFLCNLPLHVTFSSSVTTTRHILFVSHHHASHFSRQSPPHVTFSSSVTTTRHVFLVSHPHTSHSLCQLPPHPHCTPSLLSTADYLPQSILRPIVHFLVFNIVCPLEKRSEICQTDMKNCYLTFGNVQSFCAYQGFFECGV